MYSLIDPRASVHPTARIGHGCIIGPRVRIEEDVIIGAYSVIGTPPEHRGFYNDPDQETSFGVVIQKGARIFEFVTVHSGTKVPTVVGRHSAIFSRSHVAHDCRIDAYVTIGGQVSIAGHCQIMEGANVSGKSCLHQRCVVGPYSMLSPMSFLKNHLPPGEMWIGNPARPSGLNLVGLERNGMTIVECLDRFGPSYERLTQGVTI